MVIADGDHIRRTKFKGLIQNLGGILLHQNDHRNLAEQFPVFPAGKPLPVGSFPAADIQQNRRDTAQVLVQKLNQLPDVSGFQQVKGIRKDTPQSPAVFPDTAADQKGVMFHHSFFSCHIDLFFIIHGRRFLVESSE